MRWLWRYFKFDIATVLLLILLLLAALGPWGLR